MTTTEHLEDLLSSLGIRLGRSTDYEVYGLCPGHKEILGRADRRPTTWSVARTTGAHYCFSCGFGGSLVELVIDCGAADTPWNALGVLRDHGIHLEDADDLPKTYHLRKQIIPPSFLDEEELSGFTDVPDLALKRRGLSRESVDFYGVRWDPDVKMWITPVRLPGGALLGWQAKNKRLFLNHPPKVRKADTLFGIDVFEVNTTAILVESPLDVCRLYTAGFEGGVSSMGVAVSEKQMRQLLATTDDVLFALDNDEQGDYWTRRLLTGKWKDAKGDKREGTPWRDKFTCTVINYGGMKAKDVGEMTDKQAAWAIDNALDASEWL